MQLHLSLLFLSYRHLSTDDQTRDLQWTELLEEVAFNGGVCPSLPANRQTVISNSPPEVNEGWSLVDFCLAGSAAPDGAHCHYNDDDSSQENLGFSFSLFGTLYTSVFINNNGNLSFGEFFSTFSSSGFPLNGHPMIAPFWGDVDTGSSGTDYLGHVWKQKIRQNVFAVAWDHVGYYNEQANLENTFMVMISDGNDAEMGLGNNVCFCYEDMQWTTGGASGGAGGFGGTPATVGVNKGDSDSYWQVGRFDGERKSIFARVREIECV